MPHPKISIITPSYNQGKYIEETILSIINQGYPNLEYIIIDGGSTDNTVDIIKKYEKHISYWVSEPDKGQSDAINKGIAVATGDIFNWVNSDDLLVEDALINIANFFLIEEVDIVCSPTFLLHPNKEKTINNYTNYTVPIHKIVASQSMNQQGMFWRMSIIKELHGVNELFHYSMDLDLWKRYVLTFGTLRVKHIETITGIFRLHDESKTGIHLEASKNKFYSDNNAALWQYAKFAGASYYKLIKYLFPKATLSIIQTIPISPISKNRIKTCLNKMFYDIIKSKFYDNDSVIKIICKLPIKVYLDNYKDYNYFMFSSIFKKKH